MRDPRGYDTCKGPETFWLEKINIRDFDRKNGFIDHLTR